MTAEGLELVEVNVDALADWLDGTSEIVAEWADEACVDLLSRLTELKRAVDGAIGAVNLRLLAIVPTGKTVPGTRGGQAIVECKGKETTKGASLARRVAALVADEQYVDPDTGEVGGPIPPAVLAERVADALVKVFALDNASATFRAGEVKALRLRVGEFKAMEDGTPKVRFIP